MIKILLTTCIFVFGVSAFAEVSALRIRPYNRITDILQISLLDVVDRDGLAPEVEKKLALVSLGDAPRLGEQRVYSNKVVAEALRKSVVNKTWSIQIPREIVVDNRGYQVDKAAVQAELLSKWQMLCGECQIKFKNIQLPAINKKLEKTPWTIDISQNLPRGHFTQKIIFSDAAGNSPIYWVSGQIEIRKKVPVLMRSVAMNTRLSEVDFKFDWRDVTYATDTAPNAEEIIGQAARFTMNASDIIWRGSLLKEKAVQRGQIVRVMLGDDEWQVSMQARAEQDAYAGDTISLRNLQTNKLISGRVTSSGEVEVK